MRPIFRAWNSPGAPTSSPAWRPDRRSWRIDSTPYPQNKVILERDFELFFPVFSNAFQLYSLATIPNWRERCRKAACFITEVWSGLLPEYLLELLSEFDHIFLGLQHCVQDVARITGRPCSYLPLAADVVRFAPRRPISRARSMSAISAGDRRSRIRRCSTTPSARQSFYYFDTVAASGSDLKQRTFRVDNPHEHRIMLATLLKHSRYFIANRSHVNNPEFTAGRDEISARFYEGAAAGTVMIGEAPRIGGIQAAVRLAGCGDSPSVRFSRYRPNPCRPEQRP